MELLRSPHLHVSLLYDIPGMQTAAQLRYGGLDLIADLGLGPANGDVRGWAEQRDYQVMSIAPQPG